MRLPLLALLCLLATRAAAAQFDNEAGAYILGALPDPVREAQRTDRMQLSDQQPAGRQVAAGEVLDIQVEGLPRDFRLWAAIGFLPMWGVQQTQQLVPLTEGANRVRVEQDGPLFLRLNPPRGRDGARDEVRIQVEGGTPLPLYVDGDMDAADWEQELAEHADAPFVQLLGERALITLPAEVYARQPVEDPAETLAVLQQVIDWQDELAGFDASSPRDEPTRLRLHYLVDFRVSAQDREGFYMYAADQFIGMLDDNTGDLTDPESLRQQWGIWHETGHTHQQDSWTFDALGEVNVNLYSLYVQERFGEQSQLALSEDGAPTFLDKARDYLAHGAPDYSVDADDGDVFFIKLVMFHQLQQVFGWELFQALHQHFRAHPLPEDAADEERVDAFVEAICELSGHDLRAFFEQWGLRASEAALERIEAAGLPEPDEDPAQIFD